MNGAIPAVCGQEANTFPVRTSSAASSARAPARSYSCSTRTGRPAPGRAGGVAAGAGLDGRLGVHPDDPVAGPQPFALVVPLVEVEDHGGLGGEARVAGEDPRLVPPGLDGDARPRSARQKMARSGWPGPGLPVRRPVPGRSSATAAPPWWRAAGRPARTTAARSSALIRRGRPDRGKSVSPSSPRAANRPRHLRTVSTLTCRSAAMRALARPRAAASTICARSQSRCAVLAPRARFFKVLRSPALSTTGTAR